MSRPLSPKLARRLHDAALGLAYFAIAGLTLALTRFGGGVAYLWIAGALQLAVLSNQPWRRWPAVMGWMALGSMAATTLFGLGWRAALPLVAVNFAETAVTALLLRHHIGRAAGLDSVGRLAVMVAIGGLATPMLGATLGAAVVSALSGTRYLANWIGWSAAHALGTLAFAPIFSMIFSGEALRATREMDRTRLAEGLSLIVLTFAVAIAVFVSSRMPLLFLPILPVILATFRIGRLGAAAGVVIVAVVGGLFTMLGMGPIFLMNGDRAEHALLFQFYLATTALTALPVAADLTRRRAINQQLRESEQRLRQSEARLRLLTDNSTDIVMNLDVDGTIRFASPSIAQLGGYDAEQVIGRNALALIVADDRERVSDAHRAALAQPDTTQIAEFRGITGDGATRWFETHTRAIPAERGGSCGVVSAIRDVSHRKAVEAELTEAAATDPLTGLANRRTFDRTLAARIAGGGMGPGHVAIFDLDHFKAVNDLHGHACGDEVLKTFARIARASVREGDLVARLGGEEFGIILPGAGREQAQLVCDRLRRVFGGTTTQCSETTVVVTASAGIATIDPELSAAAVLELADRALYRAKRSGRNRLLLAA